MLCQIRGTSGSWAVRGETLSAGSMIIAVHEREPIAHMIEASQFFSDIKKLWIEAREVGLFPTIPVSDHNLGGESKDLRSNMQIIYRDRYVSTALEVNKISFAAKRDGYFGCGAGKQDDVEKDKPGLRSRLQDWLRRSTANTSFNRTRLRPKQSRTPEDEMGPVHANPKNSNLKAFKISVKSKTPHVSFRP